ncbi:MAG: aminotransferase class I/II-fold pyridoxal phosphate-dependent enzyme, partial [Promethearchaeota archaeon]
MDIRALKRKSLRNYRPYEYGEQPSPTENWTKLNTNENPYPPPQSVIDEIKQAIDGTIRLYPDPTAKELRKLIS